MKQESTTERLDLTDPAFVDDALKRWGSSVPKSMIVIEFWGGGDPYFGGNSDDRALGVDGLIKTRRSKVETAEFATVQEAHHAALKVANRRLNSILGVVPTWR